jgi:hypothetical protein
VYKSTDGGGTWGARNTGLTNTGVGLLAIDPTTPTTLYAGVAGGGPVKAGMFKSTDGATSWHPIGGPETGPGGITALAIDPLTPTTLYAGSAEGPLSKSTDGGGTWKAANSGIPSGTSGEGQALAIDPHTPRTLYAGTFGRGVFKSTDGAGSWKPLNSGLANTYIGGLAIDPTAPGTVYAGTGGGVFDIEQVSGCVGDCTGAGTVAISDLITLVNIALGTAQASACPHGVPSGAEVNIALIVQAVKNALDGCV